MFDGGADGGSHTLKEASITPILLLLQMSLSRRDQGGSEGVSVVL